MTENIRVIQSLQRAFEIINCFSIDKPQLKLNEIADKVGIHINTTRGLVNSLVHYGYLSKLEHINEYCLGPVFVQKASLAALNLNHFLLDQTKTFLTEIANAYQVSTRLQIITNNKLFTLQTMHPINSRYILLSRAGLDFPLHATASGKLFLCYYNPEKLDETIDNLELTKYTDYTITSTEKLIEELQNIRNSGYSIENEEIELGIKSIALPIFKENRLVGTISVTSPSSTFDQYQKLLVNKIKNFISEKLHV